MSALIQWCIAHEAIVASGLTLLVNEAIRLLPGVESNSLVQLVGHLIGDLVDAIRSSK